MNTTAISSALDRAAAKSAAATTSLEAQQYAQAALSLAHALATVEAVKMGAAAGANKPARDSEVPGPR